MNFIKFDQYDQMYFSYLEHKYDLVRSLQGSHNKIIDRDILLDLYNILFKEHIEVLPVREEEVSRNDFIKFLLINRVMESNYLAKIKYYTVFNEQYSFLFIKNLLNTFRNYSMWEDDEAEAAEKLLNSIKSSINSGANGSQQEHVANDNSSMPANYENNDLMDQLSDYVDSNISSLQDLEQLDSLPAHDKMKAINAVYNFNTVLDGISRLKKELKLPPGGPDSPAREQKEPVFGLGVAANKIIVDEMDKVLRQVSVRLETDIQKNQGLYNNLKKLSSHSYWDLALGNLLQTNPEFCFYLSDLIKNHPEVIKIARLMGNLKVIKTKKDRRMTRSTYECKMDICTSNDITNLIPLELLYLDEQLENIFYNKLIEQKLFTYDYQARNSKGRGGLIVLLDTSGSMIGDKLELLKAITLNIALIALQKKRYFALINFSSSMKDLVLLPHRPEFQEFIGLLISSYYGGTNFDVPIKRTLEIIRNFRFHRESDVLIFSDGFGKLSDEVLDELETGKQKYRFGMFGFLLDDNSKDTALARSCDRIFDLTSSQLLKDLLDQLEKTN